MKFHPINEQAQNFPKPKLSVLPLFSFKFLAISVKNKCLSSFNKNRTLYTDGRSALAHGLQLVGHSDKNAILFPAYHCGSMIEPAIWLTTDIYFYKVNQDLSPNLNHIQQLILQAKKPIKILVVVHYFGFFQHLDDIAQLCKENGITLIEDCAHAYYRLNNKIGSCAGDLAIASPRKFFPIPDGGLLTINNPTLQKEITLESRSFKTQLKALYSCLQTTTLYPKPGVLGKVITKIERLRTKSHITKTDVASTPSAFLWFNPEKMNAQGSYIAKWIMRFSSHQRIIECRRKNYQYLFDNLKNQANAHPLYALTDETVPYMFPLVINNPEQQFVALKKQGVPIWRWEELAESGCENSQHYRTHLLHLPCHQSLSHSELDWIISCVVDTLSKH
jgi:dTDP-4-amino-4,6-dideoxygalactose transaminase